jgi:hypothetical protein
MYKLTLPDKSHVTLQQSQSFAFIVKIFSRSGLAAGTGKCIFYRNQNPLSANLKSTIKVCQFTDLKTDFCELLKDGKVKILPMADSNADVFISSRNTTLQVSIFY